MKLAFLCIAGAIVLLLLFAWCMTQLHFRIGSRHLKVLFFRLPIRRVALSDIAYVSKREPKGIAERWYSTLKTSHRLLTIERKSGLLRHFCITPQNRYVFLADLKSAVRRVDPSAEWAALRAGEDSAPHSLKDRSDHGEAADSPPEPPAPTSAPAPKPGIPSVDVG